jgi:ribose/xylose/arabinose/galactoside ABC-type transport system permease subunit
MVLAIVLAIFWIRASSFGRYIMAVGGNEEAARLGASDCSRGSGFT